MTNLKYMRRFFEFYKGDNLNRQQVADDLENICSIEDIEKSLKVITGEIKNGSKKQIEVRRVVLTERNKKSKTPPITLK